MAHEATVRRRTALGAVTVQTVLGAVGATALTLAALVACSSSSSGASSITVDAVHTAAGKLGKAGGACPLGLDVNAALKTAGVSGTAAPDTQGGPEATGTTPETADAGSPSQQYGFSMIQCSYVITDGATTTNLDVNLGAMAGKSGAVVNILAPLISRDGHVAVSDLRTFLTPPFKSSQSRETPGRATAIYSQLSGSGSGVGLELGTSLAPNEDATPALSGPALQRFATALTGHLQLSKS